VKESTHKTDEYLPAILVRNQNARIIRCRTRYSFLSGPEVCSYRIKAQHWTVSLLLLLYLQLLPQISN